MEAFRGYSFRNAMAEKHRSKRARRSPSSKWDEGLSPYLPAISHSLPTRINTGAENLRQHFILGGIDKPWALDQTVIYQKAINNLNGLLLDVTIPSWLKDAAQEELCLLANTLEKMFAGQVPLKQTQADDSMEFEGYSESLDESCQRVIIYQVLQGRYSKVTDRFITPNTQIYIKEILGRSTKGFAIADRDTEIRCGLRCNQLGPNDAIWTVTLESGSRHLTSHDWKIIRPLSQAIGVIKQQVDLGDTTPYTFHFSDQTTSSGDRAITTARFEFFNQALSQVFSSLPKR